MTIDNILRNARVIPVLEVANLDDAVPLATALASGGLNVIELTLRTSCAIEAMRVMREAVPGLCVGIGTVRSLADIERSAAAGAQFLVSPGVTPGLLRELASCGVPALPGVATVSEVMTAHESGFTALKFFPAEAAGGIPYLRSFSGPLPEIRFCPTGGIRNINMAREYLALSNVACVGGTWIAPKAMIAAGDWTSINANAQVAAAIT